MTAMHQANPATKVQVTEAMWVKGYSDLEAKETTNMTGRRRGPPPFEETKMRTEEELAACGGGGARGSDSHGIRIQQSVITEEMRLGAEEVGDNPDGHKINHRADKRIQIKLNWFCVEFIRSLLEHTL